MKKLVKVSAIILTAGLATGCATNSDIKDLQSQINGLKGQVSQAASDAASAQSAAADAASRAAAAEEAANRAARYAQDTNSKLDNMFKKSMMK
jgi:murein lipoprotein